MYVTTFYSFKGGVGRTLALVNVAVELAGRGRRVLLVDFDLEAPGLDTFDLGRPPRRTPGVVDFVSAYLRSGRAPDVTPFVFESTGMGDANGGLWIMPAGAHHDGYANTLSGIDWGELYEKYDGYFLFEDLKRQWKASLSPDYVLIDSRTGHTDVGGICTRQLPDSVVILFFPNAQNLRGLTKVVRDIRSETGRTRDNRIDLHFVMSNVPDLDDEDRILEENILAFRRELGLSGRPFVIHRYDSLSLLNQAIFTRERPRSRLAKEYREVTREIMRLNPEDRDGALEYIRRTHRMRRSPGRRDWTGSERHLGTIEKNHGNDGELLYRLGLLRRDDGSPAEANTLLTRAIDVGYVEPRVFLERALIRRAELADSDGADRDALRVLNFDRASPTQVRRAISMVTPGRLTDVADAPAVGALEDDARAWIAGRILRTPEEAVSARNMLLPLLAGDSLSRDARKDARYALSLATIALGRFSEAIEAIESEFPELGSMPVGSAFNYSMALWGRDGQPAHDPFRRVVRIDIRDGDAGPVRTPYHLQCMAVSHWAVGELDIAEAFVDEAKFYMVTQGGRQMSCWRYLEVGISDFMADSDEILKLIAGDAGVTPRFMHTRGTSAYDSPREPAAS